MAEAAAMKYEVADLAKKLDIEPASARVALRKHNIPKPGKAYGWNTQAELNAVVEKLSAKTEKKAAKKAPAKKAPAKKAKKAEAAKE